ncbi:hypothetical protein RB195_000400 [Necator americanus]|uniref:Uncharacterized protein n=1 Tax=Necator americanus TaxID=51031 RepID=A0ABR1D9I9_NECAM
MVEEEEKTSSSAQSGKHLLDEKTSPIPVLSFSNENEKINEVLPREYTAENTQQSSLRKVIRNEIIETSDYSGQKITADTNSRLGRAGEDYGDRNEIHPSAMTNETQESGTDQDFNVHESEASKEGSKDGSKEGSKEYGIGFKLNKKNNSVEQTQIDSEEPKTCRKMSLRATLVHAKTRIGTHADDRTIRGERGFLKSIEKHKNRRLERLCICPVTKWLLFKERIMRLNISLVRVKRFFWIICCPPLCYIMPQVAFWPPPNEYFFYIDDGPPRIKKDVEGHKEAVEIAERKKKFFKVFHANKKASERLDWRIGHKHPCADDIDNVEAFVVKTKKNNVNYGRKQKQENSYQSLSKEGIFLVLGLCSILVVLSYTESNFL